MKQEFYYPSSDGLTQIHAIEWIPESEVRGILQIAHGMIEYIDRYDRFAQFMASQGFYVVGNDHLGHGKSVTDESQLGYIAKRNGNFRLLDDMKQLREQSQKKYPDIPFFILGHSMGSFLVREFIETCGAGIAGAILLGTGYYPTPRLNVGIGLTAILCKVKGDHSRSSIICNMAQGTYNASFEPGRTRSDWLTRDERIVDEYVSNPLNQFSFTVNGYNTLFRSIRYSELHNNLDRIPKDLPVLIASGENDPVGNFGKGPKIIAESYRATGIRDVTLILYPDDRHEILNELDKDTVYKDLLHWLEKHI